MIAAPQVMEAALDDARELLGEAIAHRRKHPYIFYRYHLRMSATYAALPGLYARMKAWYHRQLRRRYYAKAMATDEGLVCALAMGMEGGGA